MPFTATIVIFVLRGQVVLRVFDSEMILAALNVRLILSSDYHFIQLSLHLPQLLLLAHQELSGSIIAVVAGV